MKSLTSEDHIPQLYAPASPTRHENRLFGRRQALMQIQDFMDSYQNEMVLKLAPTSSSIQGGPHMEAPRIGVCANDDTLLSDKPALSQKESRAKLHKIWLAMNPSYKPATTF